MDQSVQAASAEWRPFVHRRTISWGETDAARMAYTGRFADFILEAIEGWFRDRLGIDWFALDIDERIGTPFVHLSMEFRSPVTPREPLDTEVLVSRAGRSSLSFAVTGTAAASRRACFEGKAICVFVSNLDRRPISIPPKYRVVVDAETRGAVARLPAQPSG